MIRLLISHKTSGTSNFGDHPYTGTPDLQVRSDKEDIFSWEKENAEAWIIRKVDVAITEAGLRLGVKTAIVNPPLICRCPIQPQISVDDL